MKLAFTAALLAASALVCAPAFAQDKPETKAETPAASSAPSKPASTAAGKDYPILKVGSDEIRSSEVQELWKGLFPGGSAPDFATFDETIRQNVLRGLVSERLIYQEAQKAGFDKNAEVKKRIEQMQKQIVMQSFIEDKAKALVTDAQLKAAYEEKVKAAKANPTEEASARHILVASEEEAKKIAEELKKGGDFDKIAKEKSTDKGSGARGGELGWFTKDKMVPEFADAAFKLKKGEISAPVKSAFGWHIIKLEDRRNVQVASFDEMKDELRGELTNKAVQSYVESLLKTADIKYYDADGKELPFSRSLAPAAGGDKAEEKQ
jgi:peptidyl-prolyl cis-trans isomerase C